MKACFVVYRQQAATARTTKRERKKKEQKKKKEQIMMDKKKQTKFGQSSGTSTPLSILFLLLSHFALFCDFGSLRSALHENESRGVCDVVAVHGDGDLVQAFHGALERHDECAILNSSHMNLRRLLASPSAVVTKQGKPHPNTGSASAWHGTRGVKREKRT